MFTDEAETNRQALDEDDPCVHCKVFRSILAGQSANTWDDRLED